MGRHDAYSYHSESGTADGTPGSERDGPVKQAKQCGECNEVKEASCKRAGQFANRILCTSCVNELQEKELDEKHAQTLQTIRSKKG